MYILCHFHVYILSVINYKLLYVNMVILFMDIKNPIIFDALAPCLNVDFRRDRPTMTNRKYIPLGRLAYINIIISNP